MRDSRETFVNHAFVIGHPIKHSRSPIIHGHWLKTLGLGGRYRAIDVSPEELPAFFAGIRNGTAALVGGNITIPHKEAALTLVDNPDERAKEMGATNTIWLEDGRLHATNTDGEGFIGNLDAAVPDWSAQVATAVVLGAGGAARAVIQSLRDRGIRDIRILNRTEARARELSERFGPATSAHALDGIAEHLADADLLVNTTSLGMDGGESLTLPFARMKRSALVTDIVYVPLNTPFLKEASAHGLKTVDGLGMLLHQAVPGFERWFGKRPTVTDDLRALLEADIETHR
ncbi:shikimate dehydrogenase [Rhizobium sp. RU20A]|uniref:shikimate dehydrogenase n=1 Tax=Rhizobium sp. RU20A TaxID=1907412 RepID=UPI000956213E|nr:shikimate dehydrogenase [Rhizobium sp. RU20A]SIQ84499.1 shikimate dehydrogenase [Rhizobium sp. RU20A]